MRLCRRLHSRAGPEWPIESLCTVRLAVWAARMTSAVLGTDQKHGCLLRTGEGPRYPKIDLHQWPVSRHLLRRPLPRYRLLILLQHPHVVDVTQTSHRIFP